MQIEQQASIAVMKRLVDHWNVCDGVAYHIRFKAYYELVERDTDKVIFSHSSSTPVARKFVELEGAAEILALLEN